MVPKGDEHSGLLVTQRLYSITVDRIDPEAAKVVRRLNRHGFEAYLVGGCVRDLLLGRTPKDFDVATSAKPEQLKALFRNCRIIGRRFRLAHIFFGRKIIETATFRTMPPPSSEDSDPLIWQDNEFGTAEQDAVRRDFTINGLFYDLTHGQIIDAVEGLNDLREGRLRTIGDPEIRLREDPVRILRAVKFAARLGMTFDGPTAAAMVRHRGAIADCSIARVLEEIYRLLRGGSSAQAFRQLHEFGILQVLFPELAELLPAPTLPQACEDVPVLRAGRRRRPSEVSDPSMPTDLTSTHPLDHTRASDALTHAWHPVDTVELQDEPLNQPSVDTIAPIDEKACARQLIQQLGLAPSAVRDVAVKSLWARLAALDQYVTRNIPPSEPVLLGVLLGPLAEYALRETQRMAQTIEQVDLLVTTVGSRIHISRRHRERLKQILVALRRFNQRPRRRNLKERNYFSEARLLLRLRHDAGDDLSAGDGDGTSVMGNQPGERRRRRRRRRSTQQKIYPSGPSSEPQMSSGEG